MSLLDEYVSAKAGLLKFKKLEADLRIQFLEELFPATVEGTVKADIGDVTITGSFGINHKLDLDELSIRMEDLNSDELNCLCYTPKLIIAKYKALDEDDRPVLDDIVISKPAMPTLTIKSNL